MLSLFAFETVGLVVCIIQVASVFHSYVVALFRSSDAVSLLEDHFLDAHVCRFGVMMDAIGGWMMFEKRAAGQVQRGRVT